MHRLYPQKDIGIHYNSDLGKSMMNDKKSIMRVFNNHFFEMFDDILTIFPGNEEILYARTSFEYFKKLNPTLIIKIWYSHIYTPYKNEIDGADVSFFIEKDYEKDLGGIVPNAQEIIQMINAVKHPVSTMTMENRVHTMKYIQNLSRLSVLYFTNEE